MRRLVVVLAVGLAACRTAEPARPVAAAAATPLVERPRAVSATDSSLTAAIARRLAEQGPAYRAITVEAWGGRVLLMGAVIKPEQRRKAEQLARATEGAAGVLNELVLAEDRALDAFRPDPAREDAVRRHLGLGDAAAVRVVGGVAFLLGAAPAGRAAELKADASEVEGIKWVVAHFQAP